MFRALKRTLNNFFLSHSVQAVKSLPSNGEACLLDIGAAGEVEPRWRPFIQFLNYVGVEPDGFRKFVRDIKRVRHMMMPKSADDLGNELVFKKLGKSLIANVDIKAGDMVTLDNLSGRIFNAQYIPVRESNQVIGRVAKKNIAQGEAIQYVDLENWFTNDQQGNVVHC